MQSLSGSRFSGAAYAIGAFTAWGLLPIYWKSFGETPATEILSHRMVWSFLFVSLLIALKRRWSEIAGIFANRQSVLILCLTSCIIGLNWLVYIWAVNNGHIVESSLGYFINPLVNVLLGTLLLHERLNRNQILAVCLATVGVSISIVKFGAFPWIALTLAFTFAFYGYLRKIVRVAPLVGLTFEAAVLSPFALCYMAFLHVREEALFPAGWQTDLLFVGTGVATAIPLIWFAAGARRLRLSTLGFIQYIAPSLQLAVGVFIYKEAFTRIHLVTFGLIWCALLIYSLDTIRLQRSRFTV